MLGLPTMTHNDQCKYGSKQRVGEVVLSIAQATNQAVKNESSHTHS